MLLFGKNYRQWLSTFFYYKNNIYHKPKLNIFCRSNNINYSFGKIEFLQIVRDSDIISMSQRQKLIYITCSPIIGPET